MVTFVYNYIIIIIIVIIIIIFLNLSSRFKERDALAPLLPPPFSLMGTLFTAGKGTLCTLYTYAAGRGEAVGLGEGQVPSPACGALPSHSQTDVKNQKLPNSKTQTVD